MEPIHGRNTSKFEQQDSISNMPDLVVTNIMDRLPLKDAVRTGEAYYSVIVEEDISYWILFLSQRGIKDLTLKKKHGKPLKLPTHLFSCLELKHLRLVYCCFDPPASFHGFPNLLSLELRHVKLERGKFVKFFTECPILETLKISYPSKVLKLGNVPGGTGQVKVAEIAKLANLKKLSLVFCMLENNMGGSIRIFELVSLLPKLQELFVSFLNCKDVAAKVDYNTMVLSQLHYVTFKYMKGSENEVCLIKCLLGCFPFLKKFTIHFQLTYFGSKKRRFLRDLLNLQQAYPAVNVNINLLEY